MAESGNGIGGTHVIAETCVTAVDHTTSIIDRFNTDVRSKL